MEIVFNNSKLLRLYETGSSKKYKLELSIIPPEPITNRVYFSDTLEIKIKGKPELKVICRGFYPR